MRPASLKHLLTRPALLIAAGLVLLGAAAGRAMPATAGGLATAERGAGSDASASAARATRPAFDALCRCLGASLAAEDEGAFAHVGLHAAFQPAGAALAAVAGVRGACVDAAHTSPRARLRRCPVGPSPPV